MENQFTNLSTNSNKSAAFLYQLKASFMRLTLLMCKKSKDLQKIVCGWTFRLTTLFLDNNVFCQKYPAANNWIFYPVLVMGRDNVHGRDVQDCPVHGHELCNVQDMSR